MANNTKIEKIENIIGINLVKGVGIALIITFISLIIFSILLTYTNINEACVEPVIVVTTGISILLGSIIGNVKIRKNGILNGGLVGIIYLLILYIISSLLNWNFSLSLQSIIMIMSGCICGILGGVIGVNKK